MKIFGPDGGYNQSRIDEARNKERSTPARPGEARKGEGAASASAENVSVSGRARDVAKAQSAAREAPDVRRDKVDEIKGRIDRGEYFVSGEKIAGKMIEDILRNAK
ncbi:MAG: flagellar biosynthesis anti-sigma factor FlgM [Nitrospinae bacterium]|nr:flagellar biosynthesis anti-sigma factor FlgM [Nitrospinota bacterium]